MAFVQGVVDTALIIFNGKNGKVISVGKTESYVKFGNNIIELIPNDNLKPFGWLSV